MRLKGKAQGTTKPEISTGHPHPLPTPGNPGFFPCHKRGLFGVSCANRALREVGVVLACQRLRTIIGAPWAISSLPRWLENRSPQPVVAGKSDGGTNKRTMQ